MSKILFYDLETTGLDSKKNGIHQISGMLQVDGKIVNEFNIKMKPNKSIVIEEAAISVSSLTLADLEARDCSEMDGYLELIGIVGAHCNKYDKRDKIFLCGYNNASFDNQFLREFFTRQGDNYFGSWFWSNTLDVMVYASMLLSKKRPQMENFKLMTVAKTLGIEVDDSKLHDALYDVRLTKEIFEICMKAWYKKVSAPPSIVDRYAEWASDKDVDYLVDETQEFISGESRSEIFALLDWASSFLKPKQ